MIAFLVAVGIVAGLLLRRRARARRKDELAGLSGERPTFTVSPPTVSLIKREQHRW